jgi:hypothetical protein
VAAVAVQFTVVEIHLCVELIEVICRRLLSRGLHHLRVARRTGNATGRPSGRGLKPLFEKTERAAGLNRRAVFVLGVSVRMVAIIRDLLDGTRFTRVIPATHRESPE